MKNIFRLLLTCKKYVLVILLLLCVQAYCDLSLPTYTGEILNVGLQQNGIADAVPDTIRADSLTKLEELMSDKDIDTVEAAYTIQDETGVYTLRDGADRDAIRKIFLVPECLVYQPQLTTESINKLTDTYLEQIAINYVAKEYEAQGIDLNTLRTNYLWRAGGKMLLMALVMLATSILTVLLASVVGARVGRDLRESVYEKVIAFTDAEMEQFSTASLITRCTNDITQVQTVTVMLLRMVAYAPVLAIGGIVMVAHTATGMSWIIVLAIILLAGCSGIIIGVAMPKYRMMQSLVDRLNLVSREQLTGIMPIRAFSREAHEEGRFEEASRNLYSTQLFTGRVMGIMMPTMTLVMNGLSVLIVWAGSHGVDVGRFQVGDMTAFITYAMVIVTGFLMIAYISVMLPRSAVAADRIVEVIQTPVTLIDPKQPQDNLLATPRGEVTFNEVVFHYPGAEENALESISFTARPGQTTAIIGSTGCGKSTLLNLILRFYDVTGGSITIDGVDIRSISQHRLRELLGYVPQKGVLFSGSIESNLKYGGTQITDADMCTAAEIAQATEFITSKSEGYASVISQGGTNVSGGQKQRLSIARAIAKKPQIFLFDDSFSALDYKTDLALRRALSEQTRDATVIIVAQRISTILHADQIVVLDEGRIAGIGTHEQLLGNCEIYQEIAHSQLSEAEIVSSGMKGGIA